MSHGGRRPGAGRKAKTLEELSLTGGFRRSRHAHLLPMVSSAATAPVLADPAVEAIPDALIAGLGEAGRRFFIDVWEAYELSGVERILLRQTAKALDDAEMASTIRERRLSMRLFASLASQLTQGLP